MSFLYATAKSGHTFKHLFITSCQYTALLGLKSQYVILTPLSYCMYLNKHL